MLRCALKPRPRRMPVHRTRWLACAMLLLAAMCWGLGNVANKTVLHHVGPFGAVFLRCAIAALMLGPLALLTMGPGLTRAWMRSAALLSLLFVAALSCQQIAYQTASVTNASFLVNASTVMVPVIAWWAFGYRPARVLVLAGIVTLCGVFLMSGIRLPLREVTPGDLWCLVSAALYAAWTVHLGQHAVTHGHPLATATVQFALTALAVLPVAVLAEALQPAAALAAWREVLMLGVVSTALAFGLMTWAQRHVAAATAAVLVSAESLFGAAAAIVVLGERPASGALLGGALILTAIVLVAATDTTPAPVARQRGDRPARAVRAAARPDLHIRVQAASPDQRL